jgi:glucose 1-dehydrogenase
MVEHELKNKVAIVTGAGQGIGLEICRQLIDAGASVILNDISESLANEGAAKIAKAGRCIPVAGDVSDPAFNSFLVDEAIKRFGRIDIAIANAGITLFGDFFDYSGEDLERVLKVNLGGTFFLAQAASKKMKEQGTGGKLLFMSSVTGHQAHKNLAAYSMSKAGIEMLAKNLVIELSSFGINVNTIAPGATLTERTMEDKSYADTWSTLTPTGRASTVSDVAAAALFLVSPRADQITGQTIVIDGGWSSISPSPY